jgi:hypothetical protein
LKRTIVIGAVLTLAVAGMSAGSAAPAVYKVTGGGQTLVGTTGAGNTIAFTAQSAGAEGEAAKGQFQLQLRDAAEREGIHGEITCVQVYSYTADGGVAVLGGVSRAGEPFRFDVVDGGEGKDATDLIRVSRGAAAQDGADDDEDDTLLCDAEDESADTDFARGNVQVHKAKA